MSPWHHRIRNYSSLVKISHTLFSLPFAVTGYLQGLLSSGKKFDLLLLGLVVLCVFFARNAAMSFNRIADRRIDAMNPRTRGRELPSGKVTLVGARVFFAVNIVLFITTTFFINPLCFYLSPAALAVILGYSYTKRFTSLAHFVLGLGLSLSPVGAYLAVTGAFDLVPLMYSGGVLMWVGGFDIIYALQDIETDREQKLHSLPSLLGIRGALIVSALVHLLASGFFIAAGFLGHQGIFYWIGTLAFILMMVYQHLIVKPGDLRRVNLAFFTVNGISGLVFMIFFILNFIYLN